MKHAFQEAFKEFMRVAIVGFTTTIVPLLMASINTTSGEVKVNMAILNAVSLTLLITSIARGLDKFVHEWNKEKKPGNDGKSMGIIPF